MRSASVIRWLVPALLLISTGCGWWHDRPRLFQRCRANNDPAPNNLGYYQQGYPMNGYYMGTPCSCGNGAVHEGPILTGPTMNPMGGMEVLPKPNPAIPRIEENGKQMPWDPKMSSNLRSGTEVKTVKPQ